MTHMKTNKNMTDEIESLKAEIECLKANNKKLLGIAAYMREQLVKATEESRESH